MEKRQKQRALRLQFGDLNVFVVQVSQKSEMSNISEIFQWLSPESALAEASRNVQGVRV